MFGGAATVRWAKAHPDMGSNWLPWPAKASAGAAGYDLAAAIDDPVTLRPHGRVLVPLGFKLVLPPGFEAQIRPRSGLASRSGFHLIGSPGTVDADYRGEVMACAYWAPQPELKNTVFTIVPGMRIAQMVIARVPEVRFVEVEDLDSWATERGSQGQGSTGTGALANPAGALE